MDPLQWLMQMLQSGGMAGGQTLPYGMETTPPSPTLSASPGAPAMATPAPPQPVPVPTQPLSETLVGGGGTDALAGMGRITDTLGAQVPGQVPGQVAAAPSQNPLLNPQAMAALQALQAPENENPGPPSPPASPGGPKAIDPGLLFEALLKLGVHPGQIPSLTKSLGG